MDYKASERTGLFYRSYCAWQKGAVENENKLIRQYIPKGTDINTLSDRKIRIIKNKLNARPRQNSTLTPQKSVSSIFFCNVALAG